MPDLHAEHVIALSSLIMSRMIYRRLRKMPEVVEAVAIRLDTAINKSDPDKLNHYAAEWQQIIRDPVALREVMIGSSSNSMFMRQSKPFWAGDVGLDSQRSTRASAFA